MDRNLDAKEFVIISTTKRLKFYSLGQLIFGRDMIIPIQHKVDWELICQLKQAQINKYNTRKNEQRVDDNYKVRDNVMLNKHTK